MKCAATGYIRRISSVVIIGISVAFSVVLAQASAEEAVPIPTKSTDFVTVTAQKREQSLLEVPISLTAVSAEVLETQRITTASDLITMVPNLTIQLPLGETLPVFSLRGISLADYNLLQNGPIALYYDEVYKGTGSVMGLAFFDLERVEVLRGPQGTLYGKNSTGGAVNLIARKPDFTTGGYLRVGYGNYNLYESHGAFQSTLVEDKLAFRFAYTFERADGWMKNRLKGEISPITGEPVTDLDDKRQYGLRSTFVARPSDDLEIRLRAETTLSNPHNYGIFAIVGPDGVGGGAASLFGIDDYGYFRPADLKRREIEEDYTPRRRARTYSTALTINWDVTDDLTVTSISSYDHGKQFIPEAPGGTPGGTTVDYRGNVKQYAQDTRLTSNYSGPFNFIVGFYYNKEDLFNKYQFDFYPDLDANQDGVSNVNDCLHGGETLDFLFWNCRFLVDFDQIKTSYAGYANLTYDLTDRIQAYGGLRYTHDKGVQKNYRSRLFGVDGVPIKNLIPGDFDNFDATARREASDDDISGEIGLRYSFNESHNVYLEFSRGYRGRSFNGAALFEPAELSISEPEALYSLEGGFKSSFLDDRLHLTGAGFWYTYKNQQYLDVDPLTIVQVILNLPKTEIIGAELEFAYRPIDGLTLNGGLGLLDSRVKEGFAPGLNGNRLHSAPAATLNAAITYTTPVSNWGVLTLHVDASYTSKQYYDIYNRPTTTQGGYGLLNAYISLFTSDENFGVSIWGKNLTNTYYFTNSIDVLGGSGYIYNHAAPPITFGITLEARF